MGSDGDRAYKEPSYSQSSGSDEEVGERRVPKLNLFLPPQ
jgi:hypothetical protein